MKNLRFMYILHSRLLLYAEMNFIVHISPMLYNYWLFIRTCQFSNIRKCLL